MTLLCATAFPAWSQVGGYNGPGVISPGAGDIGDRSGQAVDLRYYFDVSGLYDTGLQPFAVDSKGNLIHLGGLYGEQVDGGVYGVHRWKEAVLGIDYSGNYYHFDNASAYDGSSQNLTLGLTYQKSRRLVFHMREVAGTSALGYGTSGFYNGAATAGTSDIVNQPTSLLFDNRFYYTQTGMDMTFIQSARTSYTVGGEGYLVTREGQGLADLHGYSLHGTIQHRLSRTRTIGATYEHIHYDFPPSFGQSDINVAQLFFASALGRRWTINVGAGAFQAEVQGIQQVTLNPVIAALLGTSVGQQTFYREDFYPSGQLILNGRFHTSSINFSASESIVPGNGVYLTSRQESANASYSYTGIRKWNFGVSGGYNKLSSVGQGISPYSTWGGGGGITYSVGHALHIIARADYRDQQIDILGNHFNSYRITLGLGYSPGKIPLSLW
jgi:hypothetical protein